MTEKNLRRRTYRYLDAAHCRGAFDPDGSLRGLDGGALSADAIADHIAAEWDDAGDRPPFSMRERDTPEAEDITQHVQAWLDRNEVLL